ncbi:protein kinase domain-containing protein, partial [Methylobacterium sp. D48H]
MSSLAGRSRGQSHVFALQAGTLLHEFEIVDLLGHGGFGITYLAFDSLLQEAVAIKEYLPAELAARISDASVKPRSANDEPNFAVGLTAFLEEARLMARFRHSRLVHVRRFFEMHGTGYIVLDYESGTTLGERLSEGPLDEADLRRVLTGVLDGLEVLHEQAILHRDLKPSNVMLRADGSPVIIDFGAARDFRGRHSRSVTAIASPGYSPPEQYGVGGQQGPWTDLYALGAIAYRCVSGVAPTDSLRRLRNDPLVPASELAAGRYDDALLRTIDWMMRIDEAERPSSVQSVRDALAGSSIPQGSTSLRISDVSITAGQAGHTKLAFKHPIEGNTLELAFKNVGSGEYLAPADGKTGIWQPSPHYFSISRVYDEAGHTVFGVGPEVSTRMANQTSIAIVSRDGKIQASGLWSVVLPRPSHLWRRLAAGFLITVSLVGGAFGLYTMRAQQLQKAEQIKLEGLSKQLADAQFDRAAISRILAECGTSCSDTLRTEVQRKLAQIEADDARYAQAGSNVDQLRAYTRECQICLHKDEAIARADEIDSNKAQDAISAASKAKRADDERRAAEAKRADDERKAAEAKRTDDERKAAEAKRTDDERRAAEAKRTDDERRAAEAKRADDERKAAEAKRADDERRAAEAKRADDERRAAEAKRTDDERKAAEAKRTDDERRAAEAKRADDERRAAEAKRADDERRAAEAKRADDERKAAEAKRADDERKAAEAKRADDERKAAEAKR